MLKIENILRKESIIMMVSSINHLGFKAVGSMHVTMDKNLKKVGGYMETQSFATAPLSALQAYAIPFAGKVAFEQKVTPAGSMETNAFDNAVVKYAPAMTSAINDFSERVGQKGQFLNWVTLPAAQLEKVDGKSHLDEVYTQALELKKRGEGQRSLVVLGIGGSKHVAEFLLNMNGAGKDSGNKVYFYSDIDPVSYKNFLKETGGKIEDLNFLVVSKSGTTFETKDGYLSFRNALKEAYQDRGLEGVDLEIAVERHFAFVTDAKGTEKNLRGEIGNKNGLHNEYIKELYVHDDVGGRFSMFDDEGLFVLAYAGVDKARTERILKAADETGKKALDADNLESNTAAKAAMFNVFARETGRPIVQQQLFGKVFEGGGENWFKQLYLESLKDFNFNVGGAPASMHYASEGHFNPENKGTYSTIMTKMGSDISQNYRKYTSAIEYAYNNNDVDEKGNPKGADTTVMVEELATEGGAIKPEAIGQYIQSKHFETVYMGMLRRAVEGGAKISQSEALPEILQPSVEVYKNNFKPGSQFELKPGSTD